MRFPRAGVSESQHVLATVDELAERQFQHELLVQRRQCQEVERIESFRDGELGSLDASLGRPLFPVEQFEFGQLQQKAS